MQWFDTHCHLDRYFKEGRLQSVLQAAKEKQVTKLIAIGTRPADWAFNQNCAHNNLGRVYYSVGLHPCYVEANWEEQLSVLESFFTQTPRPVALGEIGLDYFHLPETPIAIEATKTWQKEAFKAQLTLAKKLACPVIVHSRNAFEEVVQIIDCSGVAWEKVVFHCFVEDARSIRELQKRGARASFTGIVSYKNASNVREALLAQGIEKLMIETDAPYLAPLPYRGQENLPSYVADIGVYIADLLNMPLEAFSTIVWKNTLDFFNIDAEC